LSAPLHTRFGSLQLMVFPKAKITAESSHSTQAQSTVSHCQQASPTGEWLFMDAQYGLLWPATKLQNRRWKFTPYTNSVNGV
jgi:hypothetical protein